MKTPRKRRGSRLHRFLVFVLGSILTVLVFWLLGFIVKDIGNIKGPVLKYFESEYIDASLKTDLESLNDLLADLVSQIDGLQENQKILRQSFNESKATMNQFIDIHRLNLDKNVTPTPEEQAALAGSQKSFLAKQEEFQQANEQIATLSRERRDTRAKINRLKKQIDKQRKPAREAYDDARKAHRLKVAAMKLAFLIPVLFIFAGATMKWRKTHWAPILYALVIAAFWSVGVVMHQYFPREWFKYVAIGAGIIVVLAFMISVIRAMTSQKSDAVLKQYREAYSQRRCPVCAFPIQRGPLRHAIWTSKGPKGVAMEASKVESDVDKPYTCPGCGEKLFEECGDCGKVRHSLLPYCDSCGAEKSNIQF